MKSEAIKKYLHIPAEKDTPYRVAELDEEVKKLKKEIAVLEGRIIKIERRTT